LTSWNGRDFPALYDLVAPLGVRLVLIRPMLIMGTALRHAAGLQPSPEDYRALVGHIDRLRLAGRGQDIWLTDPLNHILMLRDQECVPYVEVKADGALIATPYIQYSWGNVRRHPLAAYWEAGLHRAWRLPAVDAIAGRIHCHSDLPRALALLPPRPPRSLSHCDLVDDAPDIWGGGAG